MPDNDPLEARYRGGRIERMSPNEEDIAERTLL